jgi:hypothetical protein
MARGGNRMKPRFLILKSRNWTVAININYIIMVESEGSGSKIVVARQDNDDDTHYYYTSEKPVDVILAEIMRETLT